MAITLSTITANEVYGVRSPLPLGFQSDGIGEVLKTISVSLKIWNGDKTTNKPSTVTYTISLSEDTLGSTLTYYEVDIAELVREYINTDNFNYPTTYAGAWAAWVEIDWTATNGGDTEFTGTPTVICTNGYREYEDDTLALDTYYFPSDIKVPEDRSYIISVLDKGVTGASRVVDSVEIKYDASATATTNFGTAGTTTASLFKTATLTWGASDTFADINLKLSSSIVHTFRVYKFCKTKYENITIGYVNRVGVVDYQNFFGKVERRMSAQRETYKPALDNNYTNANAQFRILKANGKKSITTNTDWVAEETSGKMQDLLLTEYAFETQGSGESEEVKAITPRDSEITLKVDNNELVNYTLNFDYAYNHINSVR
mgnify:CR=1 FL=1